MEFRPATEVWEARTVRAELAADHELSRRLYRVLLRWLPFADKQYRDVDSPGMPNCGHFFGGSFWYVSDSASTAFVYAVLARLGEYDEALTGIPRDRLRERAVRALRYMGLTHDTGPADCVRVEGVLPYTSGKKWGGRGDHFFLASQNGRSVASIAMTAQLLWEDLDDETKLLVQNVVSSYADRWADEEPRNGVYYDTQCEENAWTAAGISAAAVLFPAHPHHEVWVRGFRNWALNAVTTYRDRLAHPSGLVDLTDGPSVKTVTFHPDFTAENHAFVHPSYLCAGTNLRALHAAMSLLAGQAPMPEALHNNKALYEGTIKPWTQFDGLAVPVQGQDWWYNRQHERQLTHTVLNVLHGDGDAAALVRGSLASIERIQASNSRGCLLEEDGEACVINKAHGQFAKDLEHGSAVDLAVSYVLYAFGGPGAEPVEPERLAEKLEGVYEYPFGNTIVYRTKDTFSSFSWRNNVMALTLPRNGIWTVTPLYASYTGIVRLKERGSLPQLANEEIIRSATASRVARFDRGFGCAVTIERGDGGLLQDVSFVALPDGRTFYAERFRAVRDCQVSEAATGMIGIRNESYPAMPELAPGFRTIHVPGGSERFEGFYGREPNRERRLGPVAYVNVDDQIGYLLFGTSGVRYINKHEFPKWKGIEDILILHDAGSFRMKQGEKKAPFAVLSMPNRNAVETAKASENTSLLRCIDEDTILLETGDGYLLYARFANKSGGLKGLSPLTSARIHCYEGTQRFAFGEREWSGTLPGYSGGYLRSRCAVAVRSAEPLQWEVTVTDSRAFVTNDSAEPVHLDFYPGSVSEPFLLAVEPGRTAVIPLPEGVGQA